MKIPRKGTRKCTIKRKKRPVSSSACSWSFQCTEGDGQLRHQLSSTFDDRRSVGTSAVHSNVPVEVPYRPSSTAPSLFF